MIVARMSGSRGTSENGKACGKNEWNLERKSLAIKAKMPVFFFSFFFFFWKIFFLKKF
jgi:hypothetical protein